MRLFRPFLFCFGLTFATMAHAEPDPPTPPTPPAPTALTADQIAAMVEENKRLKAENEKLAKPPTPPTPDDNDLREKAKKGRETAAEIAAETKRIEGALTFNLGVDTFIKNNMDLLPKEIPDIVKVAHKETYDTAAAKANALKAAMIQSYFAVQDNVNALTKAQKDSLDDYLKLTKSGKEDKAAMIYETIFEPALETVRKVKKAEELGRTRAGLASGSDSDTSYRDKLMKGSRKTYLGEKEA